MTNVIAANVATPLPKALEQHRGEVVPTIATRFIGARNDDERRSARHHQKPRMHDLAGGRSCTTLRDLDATGNEVGSYVTEPRGFILAATPLSEALCRLAAAVHQPR